GCPRSRQRDQAAAEAGEEIDAREAGPLAVRLEQLRRLPALHGAAAQRAQELDEPEVADEPVLEAAEPLEADDARRPRAEAALALDPADDHVGRQVVEPLELEAAAHTHDRRASPLVEPEPSQLEGRRRGERRRGGRLAVAVLVRRRECTDQATLETSCRLRVDELPADRAQECLCDRRRPYRPQPAEMLRGAAEQGVVRYPPEELGVVIVESERPAELLGCGCRLRSDGHGAVRRLPRAGNGPAAASGEEAVPHPPRRVPCEPSRESKRVRTSRADGDFDHVREPTASPGRDCKSVLRRSKTRPTVAEWRGPRT